MSSSIPSSILIVGSGVFGLGTAYALASRPEYNKSKITVLDRVPFPAPDGSSIDSSRIIRADYADLVYGQLMSEAMPYWEGEFGAEGRFSQCGLCLVEKDKPESGPEAESFIDEALFNVTEKLGLKVGRRADGADVTKFSDLAGAREVYANTTGGVIGTKGYVNWTSGWAHAEDAIKFLRQKAEATGRIEFRTAEVRRLLFQTHGVSGVELVSGEHLTADLTVLATGAWTPKLIDLRGIASATGQVMAYISITRAEERRLSQPHHPVLLRGDDGMFIIPPRNGILKVARHGYGYANPTTIPHPEDPSNSPSITVSLPRTHLDDATTTTTLPPEGEAACRAFLQQALPDLGDRPFTHARICWYTDTAAGDWLVTYHPRHRGLFVATGGSGHAYKFLPILGERVADVIQGCERDDLGRQLRRRWKWPERMAEDHVWTDDWRGTAAPKGMILDEEYRKVSPPRRANL